MNRLQPGQVGSVILETVLTVGVVTVASLLDPTFLFRIVTHQKRPTWDRRKLKRAVHRLRQQRLLVFENSEGLQYVTLSPRGRREAQRLHFVSMKLAKPTRWDGKWRMVLFDIPTKPRERNKARDALRGTLKRLGFVPLQKSAWVHPYPCRKEVTALALYFGVSPFVKVAEVTWIEGEERLRKHFGL